MTGEPAGDDTQQSTTEPSAAAGRPDAERAPNTLLNGLLGGVVAVVLAFLPLSTVLGGGVAGYLEGGDTADGAKAGAIAGVVAFVPIVFVLLAVLFFVPVAVAPGAGFQAALWVSLLLIGIVAVVYTVGLAAVGGVLGVYVKEEL